MFAINIDKNNRVTGATFERFADAEAIIVESIPEKNITDYLFENGEFVYSPLPEEPEPMQEESDVEASITDLQLAVAELYEMLMS